MRSFHHAARAKLVISIFMGASLLGPARAQAADFEPLEYRLKAAFLFNFAKFIDWPAGADEAPFNFCVFNNEPFARILSEIIVNKTLKNRPVQVHRITAQDTAVDCQVIYIGASERRRISQIADTVSGRPVLTVSEIPRFAERSMINFILDEQSRIKFEINHHLAGESGLRISSHLLHLARAVASAPGGRR